MKKFSKRGVSLTIVVLFSISLILIPSNGYAEEIDVKSVGLNKTTIITVTNDVSQEIKTFRIWLSQNANFESFKTEKGWIGEKTPQGVIIFTSSEPIKENESVKFGIKTDKTNPIINWKGLDKTNNIVDTGVIATIKIEKVSQNPDLEKSVTIQKEGTSILLESVFKIIPNNPNSGSLIRVVGEQFAVNQKYDFYINNQKSGDLITDNKGNFITTMEIPKIEKNSRIELKIVGYDNIEKIMSIRLADNENRIPQSENIRLSIEPMPKTVYRGDMLNIAGTGIPGTAIIAEITNPQKIIVNSRTAEVNSVGNWKISEPINIPFDAIFGKYSVTITDGRNNLLQYWQIETDKVILIEPEKIKFDAGELIKFIGTGLPNTSLELILEDSLGNELASDILQIDSSGSIEFEYQTVENEDKEGTWTLIATQKQHKEFIYVGYDEIPSIPVNIKFDKSNYNTSETAIISVVGKPSERISMIIITPSGAVLGNEIPIQLKQDGRQQHNLDLQGFNSGIYTAVVKKGGSQSSENFSVGLQTGSGPIDAKTTQLEYEQGERILLLGKTNPSSLLTVTLLNMDKKEIKTLEVASNNQGMFTEDRLRVPSTADTGIWEIRISSGSNMDTVQFTVFSSLDDQMKVTTSDKVKVGELLEIDIIASHKTSITMEIFDASGQIIDKSLSCNTTKEFICETFWPVPKDTIQGTYTLVVKDAISSDQTTFEVIPN